MQAFLGKAAEDVVKRKLDIEETDLRAIEFGKVYFHHRISSPSVNVSQNNPVNRNSVLALLYLVHYNGWGENDDTWRLAAGHVGEQDIESRYIEITG